MNPKSSYLLSLSLLAVVYVIVSCVPPGGHFKPPPTPGTVGPPPLRLVGSLNDIRGGPNAYYVRGNRGGATKAYEDQPVYEGDRIFTGPNTRMTLRFAQGGYAELAENTDPVPRFLSDFGCLIVDLLRTGWMFVDGSNVCVGAQGTITKQDSQVVYDVRAGPVQITVVGGRAELKKPHVLAISAGFRVDANAKQVLKGGKPYQLTRLQVEEAVRLTNWYQRTKPKLPGLDVIK